MVAFKNGAELTDEGVVKPVPVPPVDKGASLELPYVGGVGDDPVAIGAVPVPGSDD